MLNYSQARILTIGQRIVLVDEAWGKIMQNVSQKRPKIRSKIISAEIEAKQLALDEQRRGEELNRNFNLSKMNLEGLIKKKDSGSQGRGCTLEKA